MFPSSQLRRILAVVIFYPPPYSEKSFDATKCLLRSFNRKWTGNTRAFDVSERIDTGTFYLWRALGLRAHIVADDTRKRGTPINRRSGKLPAVNEQYDTAMS